jgi:hypothetical protein
MNDDDLELQRWLEAFEPAVEVEVSEVEVVLRSTRYQRGDLVRLPRTTKLQRDLTSALGRLVLQMS